LELETAEISVGYEATWSKVCVLLPLGHWCRRLESSAQHSSFCLCRCSV